MRPRRREAGAGLARDATILWNYGSLKKRVLFGGVEKARFKRPVVPGDRLDLKSVIIAQRSKMMKFEIEAHVSEETACSAKITVFEQDL